jgi:hypothetical protein
VEKSSIGCWTFWRRADRGRRCFREELGSLLNEGVVDGSGPITGSIQRRDVSSEQLSIVGIKFLVLNSKKIHLQPEKV